MKYEKQYHKAWLGLGGNLGKVKENFKYTLQTISNSSSCNILKVSSLYETLAWGKENQPDFLNACIEIETKFSPQHLLDFCLNIETKKKRKRIEKWGPRTLDIDILLYENYSCTSEDKSLVIPHPYLTKRPFTVVPLAELCPDMIFDGKSFCERSQEMQTSGAAIKKIADASIWPLNLE